MRSGRGRKEIKQARRRWTKRGGEDQAGKEGGPSGARWDQARKEVNKQEEVGPCCMGWTEPGGGRTKHGEVDQAGAEVEPSGGRTKQGEEWTKQDEIGPRPEEVRQCREEVGPSGEVKNKPRRWTKPVEVAQPREVRPNQR
ncbi:hypothetical protein FNV43_RR04639 [Rhamnella rubrinervis]|uniref:Uncharacterized protein n=1 Tax=Rhamnella rubrinervis TaxID=2594499 RepID=A0A8K0MPY9_9ROSA|nr:hypothetical protein FNV43_RR04639 [Rhamnella rubrinervis]